MRKHMGSEQEFHSFTIFYFSLIAIDCDVSRVG